MKKRSYFDTSKNREYFQKDDKEYFARLGSSDDKKSVLAENIRSASNIGEETTAFKKRGQRRRSETHATIHRDIGGEKQLANGHFKNSKEGYGGKKKTSETRRKMASPDRKENGQPPIQEKEGSKWASHGAVEISKVMGYGVRYHAGFRHGRRHGEEHNFENAAIPMNAINRCHERQHNANDDQRGFSEEANDAGKENNGLEKNDYRKHFFNSAKKSAKLARRTTYRGAKTTIITPYREISKAAQSQIGKKDHLDTDDDIKGIARESKSRIKGKYQDYRKLKGRLGKAKVKKAAKTARRSKRISRAMHKKALRKMQHKAAARGVHTVARAAAKKAAAAILAKAKMSGVAAMGCMTGIVAALAIGFLLVFVPILMIGQIGSTGMAIAAAAVDIALVDRVTTSGTREFPSISEWWDTPENETYRTVIAQHGILPPFNSCDRGVGAAIRWSVDPGFPFASAQTQREFMANALHFDFIGIWTEIGNAGLEPGDILVTNHDRDAGDPGHIMIYTGNEAVQYRWPGSPSNVYDAALGRRLPAVVYHRPHIYRAEIPELRDSQGRITQHWRPEILYYVFRFNGNI